MKTKSIEKLKERAQPLMDSEKELSKKEEKELLLLFEKIEEKEGQVIVIQ
jgi:hypothetical protein